MTRFDLHQHLWPELLIAGLIRRRTPPRIRCDAAGRWTVEFRTSMLGAAVEHARTLGSTSSSTTPSGVTTTS
jgi:hypothetical protein